MTAASLLVFIMLAPMMVVDGVLLAEIGCGLVRPRRDPVGDGPVPSVAVLMPAHNETASLASADGKLRALVSTGARVIVVADNCTDDTAAIAGSAGCEVVVRDDPQHRGKGHALAAGRDYLRDSPPDIVIVLDADCSIDPHDLAALAARAVATGRAVQAAYLLRRDASAPPNLQISNFAFAVKNLVRQRGARRLGAAAILAGSGMAFPWRLIATLDLATGNVVEDLVLGIALVRRHEAPLFAEDATVWSDASDAAGTTTQRARWEGGFLASAWTFAWPLLFAGMVRRDFKQFWLGAHLLVPPLTIVLTGNLVVLGVCAGLARVGAGALPATIAATALLLVAAAVFAAWLAEGRHTMHTRAFVHIPAYLAWKIAMYWRLATGRQAVAWTRTPRVRNDQ